MYKVPTEKRAQKELNESAFQPDVNLKRILEWIICNLIKD